MQQPNLVCEGCGAKFYSASPRVYKDTPCNYCGKNVKEKINDGRKSSTSSR